MQKRMLVLVSALLVLFSIGMVSAATCDDDQTIMRLYDGSNSHVSMWDQNVASYTEEICYDAIFGSTYGGANPHVCTGTNRVLSLYDTSNSHASKVTTGDYNEEVCYGDLECGYETETVWSDSCANGGEVVARMFADSNSHVSNSGDTNYLIKICCVASSLFWTDMDGNPITSADVGDMVKMIQTNTVSGDFEIWEADENPDDAIRVDDESIGGEADEDGNLVGIWKITLDDLDKTGDYDNFYFKVNGEESDDLVISDDYDDDPMKVILENPICGEDFIVDDESQIVINATDPDDLIVGNITMGGVVIPFSNGVTTINHRWSRAGNVQIKLSAVNSKGYLRRTVTSVMVVGGAGDYVAACIDKPADFTDITSSNVLFDATSSRGLRCTDIDTCDPVGVAGLWFSWRFSDGLTNPHHDGSDGRGLAYRFHKNFAKAGHNWAVLDVEMRQ